MSFERPTKGMLVFQCDVCYDTRELAKANGDPVGDFRASQRQLIEEGWSLGSAPEEHLCEDCTKIAEADRAHKRR